MRGKKKPSWHGRTITPPEFGRRLVQALADTDVRIVWFLGAGCSVSSGIPAAGELVKAWLPQLIEIRTGSTDNWQHAADAEYPGWREAPSGYYGRVIEELFESEEDRQREIERLTGGKDPGFGYAALAQLMSDSKLGPKTNVAITVNFDDLVADSLYLYTAKKPLVIGHEALTRFIRRGDQRPLVVKVHGDARLAPKNTADETARLDEELILALRRLYARARIVIVGYAGADESIAPVFVEDAGEAGPEVIYWVNDVPPAPPLLKSLQQVPARVSWVKHQDFDSLMVELHSCLRLGRPNFQRLETLQKAYESTLERLRVTKGEGEPAPSDRAPVVEGLLDDLKASRLAAQANLLEESDPGRAKELYEQALHADPTNVYVLSAYAGFLENTGDTESAAEIYERSEKLDTKSVVVLTNYALFLERFGDTNRAREIYDRALSVDPNNAVLLNNFALFLENTEKNLTRAEEMYKLSIANDPTLSIPATNYAVFLQDRGDRSEEAELWHEQAIATDPTDPYVLTNYSGFLHLKGAHDLASEMEERARNAMESLDQIYRRRLEAKLWFFVLCYEPERSEEAWQQIQELLRQGVASAPGSLEAHVKHAKESGHPEPELVEAADRAITKGHPIRQEGTD